MVADEMDENYIETECMKLQTTKELFEAYRKIYNWWKATGIIGPNWHVLDNEALTDFKQLTQQNTCTVELVPSNLHHCNAAERAIQTFKGPFISILVGVADNFTFN